MDARCALLLSLGAAIYAVVTAVLAIVIAAIVTTLKQPDPHHTFALDLWSKCMSTDADPHAKSITSSSIRVA